MEKKNVVNDSFPNEWYVSALADDISLNFRHKDEEVRWNRKLVSIECFVCSAYNFDTFLRRDVSVKASNVH